LGNGIVRDDQPVYDQEHGGDGCREPHRVHRVGDRPTQTVVLAQHTSARQTVWNV
jgi:hypothetical protein